MDLHARLAHRAGDRTHVSLMGREQPNELSLVALGELVAFERGLRLPRLGFLQGFGQSRQFDPGSVRERHRALDGLLELAHVVWPAMEGERAVGGGREDHRVSVEPPQKLRHESPEVFDTLAQVGYREDTAVETSVEISAKRTVLHETIEILMGRAHQPHVDLDRTVSTHREHLGFLKHTEQADLHLGRHVSDLVQQERTLVGRAHLPQSSPLCGGVRALLHAEELRSDEALLDGGGVDRDEGPAAMRAVVERSRQDLFAGPGVTEQHHRYPRARHPLEPVHDRLKIR